MPDEKNRKVRVVVGGESSRHVDGSWAAPEVGLPLIDPLPLISPLCMRLMLVKRRWDKESEIVSVGVPLSIVGGCESEDVTFQEAIGRPGLISETETAWDTAGLPIC